MKLNFRLDLNTIVLLLLIVVFSTILYYNFKRDRIIEVNTETFEYNKAEYTSKNTTLTLYKNKQKVYSAAWSEYTRQKDILSKLRGEYQSLVSTINANNSAAIARLFPNTNDVKYKVTEQFGLLDIKIGELNTIQSIYADINNLESIVRTSTQATFDLNNTKITNKISEIIKSIAALKNTILTSLNFTITSIVAGDGNTTITIGSATDATATRYNIKAMDPVGKAIDGTQPIVSPYLFSGLTNNVRYTFRVTADYGKLSDGTLLTSVVNFPFSVTPRAKPSFTVTMGTSSATVNIVPTPGNKMYTISVTSSTGVTKTFPVNATTNTSIPDLENGALYAFKVIADYGNSTLLESDTKTGTPRAPPTLSITEDNSKAILTITAPIATDKHTKYIISATPAGVAEKTVLDISSPITFTGLANGTPYTFSVVAVYSDGTKSSPATIQVTPKVRPAAGIIATSGNASAIITIVPPTTDLPSSIMNYLVTSSPPSNPPTKTIGASDRTTTISGLNNGTSYKFSVVVKYADGTSSVSKESSSVTPTLPAPTVATRATLPVPTVATRAPTATLPAPPVATRATTATLPAPPVATRATLPAPPVATRATLPAPPVATRAPTATLPASTVATTTTLPAPTAATTATLPAPTVTITATAGSNKATINIARSSSTTTRTISKYEITSIPYITPIIVSTVPVPVNYSRDITGLTKRKKYKFTVKAFYSGGTVSAISNEITVK